MRLIQRRVSFKYKRRSICELHRASPLQTLFPMGNISHRRVKQSIWQHQLSVFVWSHKYQNGRTLCSCRSEETGFLN